MAARKALFEAALAGTDMQRPSTPRADRYTWRVSEVKAAAAPAWQADELPPADGAEPGSAMDRQAMEFDQQTTPFDRQPSVFDRQLTTGSSVSRRTGRGGLKVPVSARAPMVARRGSTAHMHRDGTLNRDRFTPEYRELFELIKGNPWEEWAEKFADWDMREQCGEVSRYVDSEGHKVATTISPTPANLESTHSKSTFVRNTTIMTAVSMNMEGEDTTGPVSSQGAVDREKSGEKSEKYGANRHSVTSMPHDIPASGEYIVLPCPLCLKNMHRCRVCGKFDLSRPSQHRCAHAREALNSAYPFCRECYRADRAAFNQQMKNYVATLRLKGSADAFLKERELLLQVLRDQKEGWRCFRLTTWELRNDREVLVAALRCPGGQGWKALIGAPAKLLADRGIALEAVRISGGTAIEFLAPELRTDKRLIHESLAAGKTGAREHKPSWETIITLCKAQAEDSRKHHRRQSEIHGHQGLLLIEELTATASQSQRTQAGVSGEPEKVEVLTEEDGEPLRVVPLVAVRLMRPDGLHLGEIGRWKPGGCKMQCGFPGGKIIQGEWPKDAQTRLVQEQLLPLQKGMKMGSTRFDYEQRVSRAKGMPTRYLRLLYSATFEEDFDWQACFVRVPQDMERLRQRGGVKRRPAPRGQSGLAQRFNVSAREGCMAPDIFVLRHQGKPFCAGKSGISLYAWLPQWEHDYLRTHETATTTISGWVQDLDEAFLLEALPPSFNRRGSMESEGARGRRDSVY